VYLGKVISRDETSEKFIYPHLENAGGSKSSYKTSRQLQPAPTCGKVVSRGDHCHVGASRRPLRWAGLTVGRVSQTPRSARGGRGPSIELKSNMIDEGKCRSIPSIRGEKGGLRGTQGGEQKTALDSVFCIARGWPSGTLSGGRLSKKNSPFGLGGSTQLGKEERDKW